MLRWEDAVFAMEESRKGLLLLCLAKRRCVLEEVFNPDLSLADIALSTSPSTIQFTCEFNVELEKRFSLHLL